jgi:hypothetical protein
MRPRFSSSALSPLSLGFRYPIFFRDGESAITSNELLQGTQADHIELLRVKVPNHSAQISLGDKESGDVFSDSRLFEDDPLACDPARKFSVVT